MTVFTPSACSVLASVALVGVLVTGSPAVAQTPAASGAPTTETAAAEATVPSPRQSTKPYTKKTADGQPSLEGYWQYSGMSTGRQKRQIDLGNDAPDGSGFWAYGLGWGKDQQRSIQNDLPKGVLDPADGVLPLQPWAETMKYDIVDNAEFPRSIADVDPHARCLPSGVPRTNYALGYVGYQFLQAPGYVVLYTELNHQARIIPLDNRPHLGPNIKLFLGDSRGKWEGNTLTVTTKNQRVPKSTGYGWLDMNATPYSDQIDVMEKFTIVNDDIIAYETTVTDPKVMSKPWRMAGTFIRAVPGWEVMEYACHEGNIGMTNILESIELRKAEKAKTGNK